MRAAFITATGPPEVIEVGDLPIPAPGPTDVLVKVEATAVNQVDTYIRAGRYATPMPVPFVVGRDLVGTVAAAGQESGFRPGQRVWCNSLGHGGRQGSCSEYAAVCAERLYPLPEGAEPVQAVAALHPAATAYLGLQQRVRVRAGEVIGIGGAAGSIGSCALVLAKEAGLRVIATARPGDHDRCRELGADAVLDFADPDLARRVRDAAPGGLDIWWDTSGRAPLRGIPPMMAAGGRILVTAGREPQPPTAWWPFYTRDLTVTGFVISLATAAELALAARAINRRLGGAGFGLRIAEALPLDQTARAHALVETGQPRGRVVLTI
jgi:NADPH:quinone reductase-like Zn-dependent oxidoreductase